MAESVYKIIELVGTSDESFEKAVAAAVTRAASSLRDLRIAEWRNSTCKSRTVTSRRIARRSECRLSTRAATEPTGSRALPAPADDPPPVSLSACA